eukprot:TRINITY_DN1921_c0_g2_i11.p1 TRINITY_DN1921_c0_g2~~TRINITY_DN1921_c0_g2_i11.p1  ORF type:complete len:300 (-),score=64.22 TRINITY_DN1921_c0_g2_i11:118-1017(-)
MFWNQKALVDDPSRLSSCLTKLLREYRYKTEKKEEKTRKVFNKLLGDSPNGDIGDKGGRAVVKCLMKLNSAKLPASSVHQKFSKSVVDNAVIHYFNNDDEFVYESFVTVLSDLCLPLVLLYGCPKSGRTTFLAHITGNNFKGKELVWVNWRKINPNDLTLSFSLKTLGIVLFFLPVFGDGSNVGGARRLFGKINAELSQLVELIEREPQIKKVHLIINWSSQAQLDETILDLDISSLFPTQVLNFDHKTHPEVRYEQFLGACKRLSRTEDTIIYTHTLFDELEVAENIWKTIWDITWKS